MENDADSPADTPEVVHCHTPKGGLIGTLGARLARAPVVIYHVHGLPHLTAQGLRKQLLRGQSGCRAGLRITCFV